MIELTKKKKIIISITSVSVLLVFDATMLILYFTAGHTFTKNGNPYIDASLFNKDATMTAEQAQQDKNKLIADLENYHPYFVIKQIEGYDGAKQKFINADIKTAGDFYFAAAEYMAVLGDGHTRAVPSFPRFDFGESISGYADNGKWMLYANGTDNAAAELYAVNGESFSDIKQKAMRYFPIENDSTYVLWLGNIFLEEFLKKADVQFDSTLTLTYKNADSTTFDITYPRATETANSSPSAAAAKYFEATTDGGILNIKIRSFYDDGSYGAILNSIKAAVNSGIKKVIIDIRDNVGGDDGLARGILNALGFEYSDMGFTIRYSEATAKYKGTWPRADLRLHKNSNTAVKIRITLS